MRLDCLPLGTEAGETGFRSRSVNCLQSVTHAISYILGQVIIQNVSCHIAGYFAEKISPVIASTLINAARVHGAGQSLVVEISGCSLKVWKAWVRVIVDVDLSALFAVYKTTWLAIY